LNKPFEPFCGYAFLTGCGRKMTAKMDIDDDDF